MTRKKRSSPMLEKATRRAAGLASIDPNLDLGNGLTLSTFRNRIETLRTQESAYNTALSNLDRLYREMLETESELGDLAEHMLLGVAARYGKSSVEYGMAGGVPKNQRRKTRRSELTAAPTALTVTPEASRNGSQNGKMATV